MENKKIIQQWIELAEKDLALAVHAAKNMDPVPYELVCFHCQQFVEKYLKGFLVSKEKEPPYIHDLVKLVILCETENPELNQIKQLCVILTQYGVQPRYPGEMEINKEDMLKALQIAEDIKIIFHKKIPELFRVEK